MRKLRLNLSDLFDYEGVAVPDEKPEPEAAMALVRKQFAFLKQAPMVHVGSDFVVVELSDTSATEAEAKRLENQASQRAEKGDYPRAIRLYKRALGLNPGLVEARRGLSMAYVQTHEADRAIDQLLELLRLDSQDSRSLVVLANLYLREKSDPVVGERFLRKALEIEPENVWALNSLAGVCHQQGRHREAINYFDQAIHADPYFANAYYGRALVFRGMHEPDQAREALLSLFQNARMQDTRSQPVCEASRQLFSKVQEESAAKHQVEAVEWVERYRAEMEALSGYPIQIEEADFDRRVGACIQIAWQHGRDYHLITKRRGQAPEILCHQEAHELTHLKFDTEARAVGKNLLLTTTAGTREKAVHSIMDDIFKWQKRGNSEEAILQTALSLISGICSQVFNGPVDMFIEDYLHKNSPVLRAAQFLSASFSVAEARQSDFRPDANRLAPKRILNASRALNGAYALFWDHLYGQATDFAAPYRQTEVFRLSQRLYRYWAERSQARGPGDEYQVVDAFAEMLGLRGWYEWKAIPDPEYPLPEGDGAKS